ncbi:conserved hypothetical protein (putative transposase or invertase) [Butyrivibrio sp. INlla18]|uniref:Rpn family recombination-promoting nuclease/putative transposase n=1 Tax=Butyrivibrio sp. INlla18 TaxID=1520806 RepID=UPI00088E26CE|nr:Rpn family recombination-promoting nuclease/putative transposase [Butyrivibrio sp. INlla18]SDA61113.1 conserved hypothetical protein (putative transposase or invertase) [Butyrivibrio sp. INlla18]
MQQETIINEYTGKNYLNATGPITVGMTNDYMFRIVFQQNKYALKGLISSILHIDPNTIVNLEITNEVVPGVSITDKEYRMDILVTMNDNTIIDIEMQLRNHENWKCRPLLYLCRSFDNLNHGEKYEKVKPAYQISFIDFTLFEDHPEFCATYQMRNEKDNYLYTDRFNLKVIELKHEELATEIDELYGVTDWVRLFKSKTWEELKMVAKKNDYMTSTVESMYLSNTDINILKIAREREDYLRDEASQKRRMSEMQEELAETKEEIARLRKLLADNGIEA